MRTVFHLFVTRRLSVLLLRFSNSRKSSLKRPGSTHTVTTYWSAVSVGRSYPIHRMHFNNSPRRNLQSDLIRRARWRSPRARLYAAGRALLQRNWIWQWPYNCQALAAARAPYSTSSNAGPITYAFIILSILSVALFIVPRSTAQELSPSQALPLTEKDTFQQIEDRWSEAIDKRDQYALELVLSPELLDISETGTVTTRDQQIAALLQGHTVPLLLDQRVVSVRSFGEIVIVIGNYVEQPRADGRAVRQSGMFTHVYRKFLGRWSCIDAQRTAIGDSSPPKSRRLEK